jgi:hypothetical protein
MWKIISKELCHQRLSLKKMFLKEEIMNIICSWKKKVTTCGTIFINIADFVLHYVTCVKNTKDVWNNICAKFER